LVLVVRVVHHLQMVLIQYFLLLPQLAVVKAVLQERVLLAVRAVVLVQQTIVQ
tara:strand:+ start:201 stop:359 length:159 start_codon:yes stop_codon:yes gene_type:complete